MSEHDNIEGAVEYLNEKWDMVGEFVVRYGEGGAPRLVWDGGDVSAILWDCEHDGPQPEVPELHERVYSMYERLERLAGGFFQLRHTGASEYDHELHKIEPGEHPFPEWSGLGKEMAVH